MLFRRTRIGACIALALTLAKLLVIDIDPPVRDLTDYLAKDECFYVFPAYDLHEKGALFPEIPPRWYGLPVVTNVFTYAGLEIFGDNILGFPFVLTVTNSLNSWGNTLVTWGSLRAGNAGAISTNAMTKACSFSESYRPDGPPWPPAIWHLK